MIGIRIIIATALLGACSTGSAFDQLDFEVSDAARSAPWPTLLPPHMLDGKARKPLRPPDPVGDLAARAAQLRAEAQAMQRPVLTPVERDRLGL